MRPTRASTRYNRSELHASPVLRQCVPSVQRHALVGTPPAFSCFLSGVIDDIPPSAWSIIQSVGRLHWRAQLASSSCFRRKSTMLPFFLPVLGTLEGPTYLALVCLPYTQRHCCTHLTVASLLRLASLLHLTLLDSLPGTVRMSGGR